MYTGKKRAAAMLLAAVSAAVTITGCGKTPGSSVSGKVGGNQKPVVNKEFQRDPDITGTVVYGETAMAQIAELVDVLSEGGKNTILSETSLNMALSLLLEGAAGETYEQIYNYLAANYGGGEIDFPTRGNELMNAYLNRDDVVLRLANSVWTHKDITLKSEYVSALARFYNAEAQTLDFGDAKSADKINNWCSDATNGTIRQIIDPDTLAQNKNILINALYFLGDWEDPFEEYQVHEETFTDFTGKEINATMMHDMLGTYLENEYATGFMKAYKGRQIVFVGILPKEEICDENGNFRMQDLGLDELLENKCYDYDVAIKLPKFKVEDSNSLTDPLRQKMPSIFGDGADFGPMSEQSLYVTDIIQKTYVDVNETGTEASAVTAIVMDEGMAVYEPKEIKEVYLDRPFAFLLYDVVNEEVLFIGKMNTLS